MAIIGYARVSTIDQNLDRQLDAFAVEGVTENNIYCDKASGKDFNRESYLKLTGTPEMPPILHEGDTLIILSLDRLGRNYEEIQAQWRRITQEIKADIKVLDMPLLDTTAADGTLDRRFIADLTLQILSYVAAKERENIRKRQEQGIAAAKARGVYSDPKTRGGKQRATIDPALFNTLYADYRAGKVNAPDFAQQIGISEHQLYRRIRERKFVGEGYDVNKSLSLQEGESI